MANKDLVVKMTINSQDFDNGLKNAKSSMTKFNSEVSGLSKTFKTAVGSMTKAFGALGLAVGGAQIFKSLTTATQTFGDKWENTMMTAKTSFQVFENAVVSGNSNILQNFKLSIAAAREFAEAMDAFGSAQISNQYARMKYVTPFNEAMTKYLSMKTSGNATGMAFAAADMQRYLQSYSDNAMNLMKSSMNAVTAKLSAYTGGYINSGNMSKYLDQLYLEIANGVIPPIVEDAKKTRQANKKTLYYVNQARKEMEEKYGPDWEREASVMQALSEINDDALKEMLEVLKTCDSVRNEINGMRRQMNNVTSEEGGSGSKGSKGSKEATIDYNDFAKYDTTGRWGKGNIDLNNRKVVINPDGSISTELSFSTNIDGKEVLLPSVVNGAIVDIEDAIDHYLSTGEYLGEFNTPREAEEYAEMLHNRQDWYYNHYLKDPNNLALEMARRQLERGIFSYNNNLSEVEILDDEIFEPETDELTAKIAEQMRLVAENAKWATEAMASFGSVFGAIGDLAGDDPFGQMAKGLSGVLGVAAQTTSAMMAMAGAENLAGLGQILADPLTPPLMKMSLFATALSGILSAASAMKSAFAGSFASGGIVGGNSYTGDNLWARVNSGEMIIPYNDWHNANASGNVHFIIEGSQLRGVLDNYDKTVTL